VEEEALERAEEECLKDQEAREAARARAAVRRAELDQEYIKSFAGRIRELYPHLPKNREHVIAKHACAKYSGRVGRSSSAKALDESAVYLAVIAHIRHRETDYDELLLQGHARFTARSMVDGKVLDIVHEWTYGPE
jgi:hypothetical protein